ncbi:hypothetical protein T01_724 [Trichinella spiralis]|uniref:Uncharacterized protein n=1 Tax=Trichinella spiralis TaxID=6334 RepID=A0A0V1BB09_TRISP|nr:hypothetical protein T01_724 [Trichinella spiralis]
MLFLHYWYFVSQNFCPFLLLQLGYAAGRFSQTKIRLCWLFRSPNFIKCRQASFTERARRAEWYVQQFRILIIVVGELTALTWNSVGNKQAAGNTKVDQQQRISYLHSSKGVVKTEEKLADCYHDNRCWLPFGEKFFSQSHCNLFHYLTFNAKHWFVIVGYFLNFAFSRLTCTWMKGTIFIQKQEQPVSIEAAYYVKGSLRRYANVVKEKLNQHWDAIWTTGLKDETEKLEFR